MIIMGKAGWAVGHGYFQKSVVTIGEKGGLRRSVG
jgi:hypothetical protein